ncbi:hypothetical protein PVNG_02133 [Plasmodium vivax North Korean]|uniref:VIR protein n=1 Tax=Plasmodium vivax North Korean TaxID=1035514 RepID=A0A0J9TK79_PLAVI|nr:hypothetical protein PVNG_06268 [Plasmodium vivax North Korean]KMZ99250.1 hypothetical protein PVNG_02133 [Plasmodium vivax North Korean]
MYHTFCDLAMKKYTENIQEQSTFCLKLIRNLGCYPLVNNQYFDPKNDRCKILHYWIYNSVKNKQISNNLISDCFGDYKDHMNSISMTPNCPYHPYDDMYEEPMNMIILDIFQSNIHIIIDIVTRENYPTYLSVQQYICECVKIYKEMYNRYCPKVDAHNKKRNVTCDMLNTFKDTYKSFLSATQHKKYKIPSLDKVEADYLNIPMSSTVSTAVGTVAGASSILALLYKFSPARRWVHSGIKGNRGRISSNLYEDVPNELLYDGFQGEDVSSYNTRYNIGYGSV